MNNLLIRNYSFDIKKQCKSLKELEKMLEILAQELSEEQKRQLRRTQVKIFKKQKLSILKLDLNSFKFSIGSKDVNVFKKVKCGYK